MRYQGRLRRWTQEVRTTHAGHLAVRYEKDRVVPGREA